MLLLLHGLLLLPPFVLIRKAPHAPTVNKKLRALELPGQGQEGPGRAHIGRVPCNLSAKDQFQRCLCSCPLTDLSSPEYLRSHSCALWQEELYAVHPSQSVGNIRSIRSLLVHAKWN
jgi:hypothetical protein